MAHVERDSAGNLVLIDPEGVAVARAVAKHNCRLTLDAHKDRVAHFQQRFRELDCDVQQVVIVLANVDHESGAVLADALMPGQDWQQYRDRGEVPFARGLAGRDGVQEFLNVLDGDAAEKLKNATGLSVVVIDYGVAEVFPA